MPESNYLKMIREELDSAEIRISELEDEKEKMMDLLKRARKSFIESDKLIEEIEMLLVKVK